MDHFHHNAVETFFVNGDFGTETRLVCFLVGQYLLQLPN